MIFCSGFLGCLFVVVVFPPAPWKRLGPINISLPFMTADSAGIQFIRYNRSARALSRLDCM